MNYVIAVFGKGCCGYYTGQTSQGPKLCPHMLDANRYEQDFAALRHNQLVTQFPDLTFIVTNYTDGGPGTELFAIGEHVACMEQELCGEIIGVRDGVDLEDGNSCGDGPIYQIRTCGNGSEIFIWPEFLERVAHAGYGEPNWDKMP